MVPQEKSKLLWVNSLIVTPDYQQILLILKNKPDFLKGMLNGIGGKVEDTDLNGHYAIAREVKEETGLDIIPEKFNKFLTLKFPHHNNYMEFFSTVVTTRQMYEATSMTDEPICIYDTKDLRTLNVVPNIRWIFELFLSQLDEPCKYHEVTEYL